MQIKNGAIKFPRLVYIFFEYHVKNYARSDRYMDGIGFD